MKTAVGKKEQPVAGPTANPATRGGTPVSPFIFALNAGGVKRCAKIVAMAARLSPRGSRIAALHNATAAQNHAEARKPADAMLQWPNQGEGAGG